MTFLYHIPLARRQDFQIALLLEKAVIGEIRGNKGIHVHLCEKRASKSQWVVLSQEQQSIQSDPLCFCFNCYSRAALGRKLIHVSQHFISLRPQPPNPKITWVLVH